MTIKYIQDKHIDTELVSQYLSHSTARHQWSNNGPVKAMLENKIAELIQLPQGKRIVCTANGTAALHALMFCYEKRENRKLKWVTPAYTFPSSIVNKSKTKIADIDPSTYTIRYDDIKDADGIIITNLFGTVVDFDPRTVKDKIVIYDNASSFMSLNDNVNISLMGDATFSSLHHTKTLGFGEGGFAVIDESLYDDFLAACCFGFSLEKNPSILSSNFKMSDISAAYILQHIENYNIQSHYNIQDAYIRKLNRIPNISIFNNKERTFFGNLPIVFNKPIKSEIFRDIGIEANKYYKPLAPLKNSMHLYERIINFPLHCDLTEYDIDTICNVIGKFSK